MKAYSAGRNALFARGFAAAIPDLQRAIAIDPQFAMAHADLGFFYWNMGQTDLGAEHTRKAYELRDRVSDRERLFILFLYDRQVTGNLQKELQTIEAWVQTYPRDWQAWTVWGGWGTRGTGQYERGIQAAEEAIRIDPGSARLAMMLSLSTIFRLAGSQKPRLPCSGLRSANWNSRIFWSPLLSGVS